MYPSEVKTVAPLDKDTLKEKHPAYPRQGWPRRNPVKEDIGNKLVCWRMRRTEDLVKRRKSKCS